MKISAITEDGKNISQHFGRASYDVLLSRLAGKPATGISVKNELGVILGGLLFVPLRVIVRLAQSLDSEDNGINNGGMRCHENGWLFAS